MSTTKNPENVLGSLYEALGIPQHDHIYCFALAEQEDRCPKKVPQTRRKKINAIIKTLEANIASDEDQEALEALATSLMELAKWLLCYRPPPKTHALKPILDGETYSSMKGYIYALLASRFRKWQTKMKSEEKPNMEHTTASRSSKTSLISLKTCEPTLKTRRTRGRCKNDIIVEEDEQDHTEGYSEDEDRGDSEDEEVEAAVDSFPEGWTQASPQRPKLVRESPIVEREIPVTPVRGRVSRSHSTHLEGSCPPEEFYRSLSSLSVTDDAFALSPVSVTSPDPSEIFTPTSTASTPFSVVSTPGYESRRSSFRNESCIERHEESPTRRKGSTDAEILSRDMRRRMKLDEDVLGDGNQQVKSGEKLPMTFCHKEKSPVHNILDRLMRPREGKPESGYIYCFAEKSAPGYLKIGFTKSSEGDNSNIERRLQSWRKQCGHDIVFKFKSFMPCAVKKMESLIHLTLHKESRIASCPAIKCTVKHQEWFEISEDEALHVVKVWERFSKLKPFDERGNLKGEWEEYASSKLKEGCVISAKGWLKTDLVEAMGKTAEKSDKDKILNVLAQIREKKKTIERQLLEAEQDEERIRKTLSELKIGPVRMERK